MYKLLVSYISKVGRQKSKPFLATRREFSRIIINNEYTPSLLTAIAGHYGGP